MRCERTVKDFVLRFKILLSFLYRGVKSNSYRIGKGNILKLKGTFIDHIKIDVKGVGNVVVFDSDGLSKLSRCRKLEVIIIRSILVMMCVYIIVYSI